MARYLFFTVAAARLARAATAGTRHAGRDAALAKTYDVPFMNGFSTVAMNW